MCLPWCNSMAFGCASRPRRTPSRWTSADASARSARGKRSCCWSRWGSGRMAVASGRFWIGKWPMGRAKRRGSLMSHRLWERGLRPENGLQAVIRDGCGELGEAIAWVYGSTMLEQRCIFHKLRNVTDKCREELKGEANKETRKQLMEQASALYQAENAEEARQRLMAFANAWRAQTPKAVATLERDFEQTIASYALDGVARELIRTTSLLERTNRSCGASFAKCVALAVRRGLRWPYISRSNGSTLAGRSKRGGKPLTRFFSTS